MAHLGRILDPLTLPKPLFYYVFEGVCYSADFRLKTPKRASTWPEDGSKSSQEGPKRPQESPKRPQEAPKRRPRGPKSGPGRDQDGPKMAPRRSQVAFNSLLIRIQKPTYAKMPPGGAQEGTKGPKRPPRGRQEVPKRPPRDPQEAPKRLQEAPKRLTRGTQIPLWWRTAP